jgi:hypothetical protein
MATAKKRDPAKWARAKAKAKAKMGGKHSARAMQLAVKNKLSKWSKQKWDYVSKGDKKKPKKKRGRYLPESVRKTLTKSQKAATNRKKRAASAKGKGRAKYSKAVAKKVRRAK